ncbi:unnamed protein product, partial [Pylaiella littoralis]
HVYRGSQAELSEDSHAAGADSLHRRASGLLSGVDLREVRTDRCQFFTITRCTSYVPVKQQQQKLKLDVPANVTLFLQQVGSSIGRIPYMTQDNTPRVRFFAFRITPQPGGCEHQ